MKGKKLTDAERKKAEAMIRDDVPLDKISKTLGRSVALIYRIKKEMVWEGELEEKQPDRQQPGRKKPEKNMPEKEHTEFRTPYNRRKYYISRY